MIMNVRDEHSVLVRLVWVSVAVEQLKIAEAKLYALITTTLEDEVTGAISRVRLGIQRRRHHVRLAGRADYPASATYRCNVQFR